MKFGDAANLKFHGASVAPQSWGCLADSALRVRTLVELVRCAQDDVVFLLMNYDGLRQGRWR